MTVSTPYKRLLDQQLKRTVRTLPFRFLLLVLGVWLIGYFFYGKSFFESVNGLLIGMLIPYTKIELPWSVLLIPAAFADAFIGAAALYFQERDLENIKSKAERESRGQAKKELHRQKALWPKQVSTDEQQTCDDFIANLCVVKQFKVVKEELIHRWGVGIAPAMLFGGFGKQLVTDWDVLSAPDRSYVCDLIEKAIAHGGEQLKSMTRLGLLKSMGERLAIDSAHQREITAVLGKQSRACLESFIKDAAS